MLAPSRTVRRRARRRTVRRAPTTTGARAGAAALAVALGLVGSGSMVWQASSAAFTSTTATNVSWTTGNVQVTVQDSGSVLFSAERMLPGDEIVRCVRLEYFGDLNRSVRLTVEPADGTDPLLADTLQVVIENGTWDGARPNGVVDCKDKPLVSGVNLWFPGDHTLQDWADLPTGVNAQWANGARNRWYRFIVTLPADAPDATQGATAGATFRWTATAT